MYYLINFLLTVYNGGVIDNQTSPTPQKPDNVTEWTTEWHINPMVIIALILLIPITIYIINCFKKEDKDDNNDTTKKLG